MTNERLRRYLALLAPGTQFRVGLERIVAGGTGALIVCGTNKIVQASATGGFHIHTGFSAARLRELAKLDGGIILDNDLTTIISAGVHLVSDPVPSEETGTRHRSADQLSKVSGIPVVTVSASMSTISLFIDGRRYPIENPNEIVRRANQTLATLGRYRESLDAALGALTDLEVRDNVVARDVAMIVQRNERIRRLRVELSEQITQLGSEGRLLALQHDEIASGIDALPQLLADDYGLASLGSLAILDATNLGDIHQVAASIGLGQVDLDSPMSPRGLRILTSIPGLSVQTAQRLIDTFGGLHQLFGTSLSQVQRIDGMGDQRARMLREALSRLSDSALGHTP